MYEMTEDQYITLRERNKDDLSIRLDSGVTVDNIDELSPERIFVGFINAIRDLIVMDAADYADNYTAHPEWIAEKTWERMHPRYKWQILDAIPDIMDYTHWTTIDPYEIRDIADFIQNIFFRVVIFKKAEIVKRAQTKMLKEEIAMKVMHPDRIERMLEQYGEDVTEYY